MENAIQYLFGEADLLVTQGCEVENVIAELIKENYTSSWLKMENDIATANRFRLSGVSVSGTPVIEMDLEGIRRSKAQQGNDSEEERLTIDRRKLRDLACGKLTTPLSLYELVLLDTYFIRNGGPGLAELPLFRRREDLFQLVGNAVDLVWAYADRLCVLARLVARVAPNAVETMLLTLSPGRALGSAAGGAPPRRPAISLSKVG